MSEPSDDPELRALFVDEIRKHAAMLARASSDASVRARTLHAMRGAAAMMGLTDVAGQLAELEVETRAGDADAGIRALPKLAVKLRAGFQIDDFPLQPRDILAAATEHRAHERRAFESPGRASFPRSRDPCVLFRRSSRTRRKAQRLAGRTRATGRARSTRRSVSKRPCDQGRSVYAGSRSISRGAHALEAALLTLKSYGRDLTADEIEVLNTARTHLGIALSSPQPCGAASREHGHRCAKRSSYANMTCSPLHACRAIETAVANCSTSR